MPTVQGTSEAALRALRETDWAAFDATTDEDIARQIEEDPDVAPDMALPFDVTAVRRRTGLSQTAFAETFGLPLRTLQDWERGAKMPSGPAKTLLLVIDKEPDAVKRALRAA